MSLTFSQIITRIDRNCKSNTSSYSLAEKTADVNLAMDKALSLIFKSAGRWQFDDSNHPDYPIITAQLTTNVRDYPFITDEQGNLILDVYKVMIKNPAGIYFEIYPVDQQSDEAMDSFWSGQNTTGIPSRYDKTANGIFLDCLPNYTLADGVKVFINRESTYFTTSDTTKKPGFAGLFHEYLALRPSYQYAYINSLENKEDLKNEMLQMELDIKQYYRDRSKDETPIITSQTIISI